MKDYGGVKSISVDDVKVQGYNDVEFSGKATKTKSRRKCHGNYLLAGSTILFLVTTIVFLALFVYFCVKYNEEAARTSNSPSPISPETQICMTPQCVQAAAVVVDKMNMTADPCLDFHEFACGGFNRKVFIPEGTTKVSPFTALDDSNQLIMKDIITQDIQSTDPVYLQNMKRYYRACINEGQIELNGVASYLNETEFAREWPTLNPTWNEASFNLSDVMARYAAVYILPFFQVSPSQDLRNSSARSLYMSDAPLGLAQAYYSRARNDSYILAYQKYLAESVIAIGADRTTAEQDAKEVVDLEIAMSKIMWSVTEKRDLSKQYNLFTLKQLSDMYPKLEIAEMTRAMYRTVNTSLTGQEQVIVLYPSYISNLTSVISSFSNRTLQNLFSFKYGIQRISDMSSRLRTVRLDFDKVLQGKTEATPRWKSCLSISSNTFSRGMSKQFVLRTFPVSAKRYMEEMIDNLERAFKTMLEQITWMTPATKSTAFLKLSKIKRKVGYPDSDFTDSEIETVFEKYKMLEDNYYANSRLRTMLLNQNVLSSLTKPVDKNEWKVPPHEVNAGYSVQDNEVIFPAAILQPPVFSQTFQDSMNYGAVGMVIGHEITHGFDDRGSQFDASGNLVNWWGDSDRNIFLQKTQCMVDQYSAYFLDAINMTVNGVLTIGENVADNGGVKESFRAYKEHVQRKGEQPVLPGLGLTNDQLFFLSFGQLWCEKIAPANLLSVVTTDTHPPAKYRIIGPLQNSLDFATAYNCPVGSYMNPVKKCSVW